VPLLQLLDPLRDKFIDLLIFATKLGGERLLARDKIFLMSVKRNVMLRQESIFSGSSLCSFLLRFLQVRLFQEELRPVLAHLFPVGSQLLKGLGVPDLHLLNALLKICFGRFNNYHSGICFLFPSTVECLELAEIFTHGLEELILFRFATAGAWVINNFKPDSGDDFFIKGFPFSRRFNVCRARQVDE
jgi:hypothetical protein